MAYDYDTRFPTPVGMAWVEQDVRTYGYEDYVLLMAETRELMDQHEGWSPWNTNLPAATTGDAGMDGS